MTGRHTPTPWLLEGRTVYALDETESCNRFSCRVEGGFVFRSLGGDGERTGEAELDANAEFIVRACNSHDEFGEALADVCAILDCNSGHDGESQVYDHEAIGEEISRLHEKIADALSHARSTDRGDDA